MLINKVREWIDTQGYPFEMIVAKAFRNAGFTVAQSVYYIDKETDQPREIDVIAHHSVQVEGKTFYIVFVIECKSSKGKPWIAFKTGNHISLQHSVIERDATRLGKALLRKIIQSDQFGKIEFLNLGEEVAYGLTQAFTNGNQVPFSAISSVTKAIDFYFRKFDWSIRRGSEYANIYFPIIAIQGELFELKINESNEPELAQSEKTTLLSRRPNDNSSYLMIDIMTDKVVELQAKLLMEECHKFFELFSKEVEETSKEDGFA